MKEDWLICKLCNNPAWIPMTKERFYHKADYCKYSTGTIFSLKILKDLGAIITKPSAKIIKII